jgi:alkylhydroperoxidase family enzyme
MPYLRPLSRAQLAPLEPMFKPHEARLGFVPNGFLISARNPEILQAYQPFTAYSLTGGSLPLGFKLLCAMIAAATNGCVYCQTHLNRGLEVAGVPMRKVQTALTELDSTMLTAAQRAALQFTRAASQQPSALTESHCLSLMEHFQPHERAQIVSLIGQFQYLSRINGMMGSEIEAHAYDFAVEHLTSTGWRPGIHAPGVALHATSQSDITQRMLTRRTMAGVGSDRRAQLWSIAKDGAAASGFAELYGYIPNFARSMTIDPTLASHIVGMSAAVVKSNSLEPDLQTLARCIASLANGSRYGQAINAANALRNGVPAAKIAASWTFENSPLFAPAEKAALRLACAGALQPQDVAESHYQELALFFSERQVMDLIYTIAWQAFLDRWADICAIPIDVEASTAARELLSGSGWRESPSVPLSM